MNYTPKHQMTHSIKIPSVEKRLEYREYTVGEEKQILLIDDDESINSKFFKIKKLVARCLLTEIDFEKVSPSEIIFLFIAMRIKSVGEDSYTTVICKNCIKDVEELLGQVQQLESKKSQIEDKVELATINKKLQLLNEEVNNEVEKIRNEVKIDLNKIKIITDKDHTSKIKLSDNYVVEMKYGINHIDILEDDIDYDGKSDEEIIEAEHDNVIKTMAYCIDTIYDGEDVISNLSVSEKIKIINDMPSKFYKKMEAFITKQSKIEYTDTTKCGKCGNDYEFSLKTIQDFF